MKESLKDKLFNILSSRLPEEKVKTLNKIREQYQTNLINYLIQAELVTEQEILTILSKELKVPAVDLTKFKIDSGLLEIVPEKLAKQYCVMPLSRIGNVLTVALCDPLNLYAYDDLKSTTGCEINISVALSKDILAAIERNYHQEDLNIEKAISDTQDNGQDLKFAVGEQERVDIGEALQESQKPPIVKIVDLILNEALKMRASDIHIEPLENDLRVRLRVDGNLRDVLSIPRKFQNAVTARVKIISGLDITEFRVPQDGRFKARILGKEIDYRVSLLPTLFGGKLVLRILDKSDLSVGLQSLGFDQNTMDSINCAISSPFGMILISGPTGSGKSTTLYSILTRLNSADKNLVTIEDPVEYQVEGITQVHVNHEIGLTFANGLRSILRQSPDVIMVGEIRDFETADIAVKASLTGQLVLSTLHTNDACGVITRLIDMGVEPFLVSASLIMTCAQRLVRKICPNCRKPVDIPAKTFEEINIKSIKGNVYYEGEGCSKCNNSGYYGRMAIMEVLMIDDQIRDMIIKGASSDQIKDYAIKNKSMRTLRDDALFKFADGQTTLEEVLRITTED